MIAYLRGTVLLKQAGQIIIETGGVGYEVSVPLAVLERVHEGQEAALFVHHAVRDDGHYLYGFLTLQQRGWFREMIRVSGVGPKIALLILSGFDVDMLTQIVRNQDSAALIKLPGVGKKTAERLLIELNDRVARLPVGVASSQGIIRPASAKLDAEEALVALGYKPSEAAQLIERVGGDDDADTDTLIRRALQLKFTGKP
ncbi:Holliday junction branch migration protein RuvA [Cardiobacterium sp. Marseille-Q4385]|uniref:Holliday junction branch migration protein RuvA n=1 Tax=Cardiobacterium sp. Marseille-Q4385 TaxID=2866573 RepID=UPI001CE43824|nr:Holliday junction branch migration protein RuvA [Cardiobacterium sp. Marseille-Q4385]